jgi:hypothetical protein
MGASLDVRRGHGGGLPWLPYPLSGCAAGPVRSGPTWCAAMSSKASLIAQARKLVAKANINHYISLEFTESPQDDGLILNISFYTVDSRNPAPQSLPRVVIPSEHCFIRPTPRNPEAYSNYEPEPPGAA